MIDYSNVNKISISYYSFEKIIIKNPRQITKTIKLITSIKKNNNKDAPFIDLPQLRGFTMELYNDEKLIEKVTVIGGATLAAFWDNQWHVIPFTQGTKKLINEISHLLTLANR